jgi:O-methyltransferase
MAMDVLWQERLNPLVAHLKTKTVVIYGTGKGGAKLQDALRERGVDVTCFTDKRAGTMAEFRGVPVATPESLKQMDREQLAILVGSHSNFFQMEEQLERMGFRKGVEYFTPMEPSAPMKYGDHFMRIYRARDPERGATQTREETYTLYQGVLATRSLDGCLAEVGVFRGGSAKIICEAKGDAPLYLCDTFEGMPSIQNEKDPEGVWVKTHTATSLESVAEYVGEFPNVRFVKGIFPDSEAQHAELEMGAQRFKFVHLDVDLYESTLQSLAWFWPRMVSGGWVVTHNYNLTYGKWGNTPGVKKAYKEFLKDEACRIVEIAETQALIVKP